MASGSHTSTSQSGLGFRIYRLLQWVIIVFVAVGLVWGWQFLRDPTRFPVRVVKVEASYQHIDRFAVQQIVLPYVGKGFFALNVRALRRNIMQMPWVAQASVERVWPDKLVIKIAEQQAVARVGGVGLVNDQGQVFTPPANTFPASLPVLNARADQLAKSWQYYREMNAILLPLQLSIQELDLNDRQSVSIRLNNGMVVLLGHNEVLFRLQRFVRVYRQIFAQAHVQAERVDLRYENGLSVKWSATGNTVIPNK